MVKNMGTADKVIRLTVAVIIALLFAAGVISGTWAIVLLVVAALFVLTSFLGTCFFYLPFGIHTNRKKQVV